MIITGMTARPNFSTAEIRILPPLRAGKAYRAALRVKGWREFPPRNLRLDLAGLAALEDPQAYGKLLGKKLFSPGGLGADYRETLAVMQSYDKDLHLRLAVEPPELLPLRWERVYHPFNEKWLPLAATADTPLCRWAALGDWTRPQAVHDRPLRMLVVIASPEGIQQDYNLAPIAPAERDLLRQKLDGQADLSVTYLESGTATPPTLNALRAALQQGAHLIHFLCHGALVPAGSVLFLEKESDHTADPVTAERLVDVFSAVGKPPLFAFLAACESARFDSGSPLQPVGLELVEKGGVSAALAMFDKVTKETAHTFAGQFYTRLFLHGMVDVAANEARQMIQGRWDWGAPVLFSRLEDNQLIDFPVGMIYENALAHNDNAFAVLKNAQQVAQEQGLGILSQVNDLIEELSKSHRLLSDLTGDFRRTGRDPATFAQNFEPYYYQFKDLYDGQTWTHEGSSCTKIGVLGTQVLQIAGPYLKADERDKLSQEIGALVGSDLNLIHFFREFLDQMNATVEQIWGLTQQGRVTDAVQAKLAFEAQISPSLRRSKEIFEQMTGSLHYATAA